MNVRTRTSRGVTLIIVMVIVVVTALVGVGALDTGRAIAGAARAGIDDTEARTLAIAGVRAAAEELLAQRDALLEGRDAELPDELELWPDGDRRAVAILLPIGPNGETVISEAAKLDVNRAEADHLAALPVVGEALAEAIVGARPDAGYATVLDLLAVEGVTPELLFGARERWATPWEDADLDLNGAEPALLDLLTTSAAEPNLQRGLGEANAGMAGQRRINLNREWSDDLERELMDVFDDQRTVNLIRLLNRQGAFEDEERFLATLVNNNLDADDWHWVLDLFSTTNDPYLLGRVDLLRAGEEVLACVPGIDAELAAQIAASRRTLSDDSTASPTWMIEQGLVTGSAFAEMAPWVCVRSLQYRVRVRTGIVTDASGPYEPGAPTRLERERVTDVVVDVAAPRPRLAQLIDVTDSPLIASLMRAPEDAEAGAPDPIATGTDTDADPPEPAGPASSAIARRAQARAEADARDDQRRAREEGRAARENTEEPAASGSGVDSAGVDRRTGRWTSGAGRGRMPGEEPSS